MALRGARHQLLRRQGARMPRDQAAQQGVLGRGKVHRDASDGGLMRLIDEDEAAEGEPIDALGADSTTGDDTSRRADPVTGMASSPFAPDSRARYAAFLLASSDQTPTYTGVSANPVRALVILFSLTFRQWLSSTTMAGGSAPRPGASGRHH